MSEADFPAMTSHRPYLLRALYEWIVDNGMTPHVLVDAGQPGVRVPQHAIKDGKVVLNIAERAVMHLQMDNESVRFSARFGGVSHPVDVPVSAVVAIYARETGQGMVLPEDVAGPPPGPGDDEPPTPPDGNDDGTDPGDKPAKRPHLRVVK
ncbi:MAG: ClpXP protease specificity-enhancing factor [Gammaproteobacteria bacterium]|nr:ClpXP protease specificity-enhancing factor [Gammaproteobacteria bacterium]